MKSLIILRQTALTLFLFFCFTAPYCAAIEPPTGFTLGLGTDGSGTGGTGGGTDDVVNGDTPNWHFTVPRGPSRTSGVAPLSVFFSAGLTPSSPSERSFHDYAYSWDFGDPTSGNWGTDGKPRNTDNGPVAAHVFEQPGTYTVTLRVRNASGLVDKATFSITVNDPNVIFAGDKTTCVSDTAHNDFSGCPAGADRLTTDSLSDLPSWTTSGRRVLFHRGSSWTQAGGIYPDYPAKAEMVRIGAYGPCQNPDANGICANAPHITVTGSGKGTDFFHLYNNPDWVISDLSFSAAKDTAGVIGGVMGLSKLLVYRLKTRGFFVPLGWAHWRSANLPNGPKDMAIVSCDTRDSGGHCVYAGSERFALLGNELHHVDESHVVRNWWSYLGVLSHNHISGASTDSTTGRQALKLHGPKYTASNNQGAEVGNYAKTGGYGLYHSTQFVVISNNIFGSSGPWPVSIGPQDDWSDERLSDIIFENNKILADYGIHHGQYVSTPLHLRTFYTSVRNNIIDGSYSTAVPDNDFTGIEVGTSDALPEQNGMYIYDNTIYRSNNFRNWGQGIKIDSGYGSSFIKNNLVAFKNSSSRPVTLIVDDSGKAIISNNVLTTTPGFVDPNNSDPLKRNFSLTSSSTMAIDKGDTVPVFYDFYDKSRTGTVDIGACTY